MDPLFQSILSFATIPLRECGHASGVGYKPLFVVFSPIMYIIDIVKRGSAYKHLLLLLPFQSDNENVVTCLL